MEDNYESEWFYCNDNGIRAVPTPVSSHALKDLNRQTFKILN